MRRLSTVFLACFLAVLAGLSGVVAWKVMARRAPPAAPEPARKAEYQITEIHINETLDGNLRWTLDADEAEVYDQRGITVMRQVRIEVFSEGAQWTVTSDEGTLDNARHDVSLRGNVVVRSSEGLEMRTPRLKWHNERRGLFTDDPVEIRRAGMTITGEGLHVRMREEHAVVDKKVRVVITDGNRSNLAIFPRSKS